MRISLNFFGTNIAEYGCIGRKSDVERIVIIKREIQIYLALDRSLD